MSILANNFKFKPVVVKKQNNKPKTNKISKLVYCVCLEETPNNFIACVNIPSELEFPDTLNMPFTEDSYTLKGKTNVFMKKLVKNKHIRICRDKISATHAPGLEEIYTPFRDKYVYSGYIVNFGTHLEFMVNEFVDHYINAAHLVPNINLDIKDNMKENEYSSD